MSSAWHLVRDVFVFPGYPESSVRDGCERAVQLVYWALLLVAMPAVVWEHAIYNPSPIIWLYAGVALLYMPLVIASGPRYQVFRLLLNGATLTALGLSINFIYGWEPQPGLYVMVPVALMAFSIHGGRGLLAAMAVQMPLVAVTTLWLHPLAPWGGVMIALTTWLAINITTATVALHMLRAVRETGRERSEIAARLMDSDELLLENERSVHHIVDVGLGEAQAAAEALVAEHPELAETPAFIRLRRSIDGVYEALG